MIYIYNDETPIFGGRITIDYTRNEAGHTLKLVKFDVRYPTSGIDKIFEKGIVRINGKSRHALITGEDFFVLYPYRNGTPFLFEREEKALLNFA